MVRIIVNHRNPRRTSHGAGRSAGRGDVLSGDRNVRRNASHSRDPSGALGADPRAGPSANRRAHSNANLARVADTIRIRHRVRSQLASMSRALPLQPTAAPLVRKPASPFEQRVHRRPPKQPLEPIESNIDRLQH